MVDENRNSKAWQAADLAAVKELNGALSKLNVTGGDRVALREALTRSFLAGRVYGAWEEPGVAPRPSEGIPKPGESMPDITVHSDGRIEGHTPMGREIEAMGSGSEDAWAEIRGWWEQTAHDEVAQIIGKAQEYGGMHRASDLTDLGRSLVEAGVQYGPVVARVNGNPVYGVMTDAEAQELGVYFYLRGKFARWVAAIKEGRPVSDDTLHDIGVYIRMVQRIRATGGWPV